MQSPSRIDYDIENIDMAKSPGSRNERRKYSNVVAPSEKMPPKGRRSTQLLNESKSGKESNERNRSRSPIFGKS